MVGRGHTKPWGPSMEATASITSSSFFHPRRSLAALARAISLAAALALASTGRPVALAAETPADLRTLYKLQAVLDMSAASLDVTESVRFTNLTGRELGSVVLHLPPAEIGGASIVSV